MRFSPRLTMTTHGLRAIAGALAWGLVESIALARSRRALRRRQMQ
jgi:hypothetical protein